MSDATTKEEETIVLEDEVAATDAPVADSPAADDAAETTAADEVAPDADVKADTPAEDAAEDKAAKDESSDKADDAEAKEKAEKKATKKKATKKKATKAKKAADADADAAAPEETASVDADAKETTGFTKTTIEVTPPANKPEAKSSPLTSLTPVGSADTTDLPAKPRIAGAAAASGDGNVIDLTSRSDDDAKGKGADKDAKKSTKKSTKKKSSSKSRGSKPRSGGWKKDAFFAKVLLPDNTSQWFNASHKLGKDLPFDRPRLTAAMRVYDDVVTFAVKVVTKKEAENQKAIMPNGVLSRLARTAHDLKDAEAGFIYAQHEKHKYRYVLEREAGNVVKVKTIDPNEDPVVFELGRRPSRIEVFIKSPAVDRMIAVSWLGYLGAPGKSETVLRGVCRVLNSMTDLGSFAQLAQMASVDVPAIPDSAMYRPVVVNDDIIFTPDVQLFNEQTEPLGAGKVEISIDLNTTDANEGLLLHINPSESLMESMPDYAAVLGTAVRERLEQVLGAKALQEFAYEIILGEVGQETIDIVRGAATQIERIDLTPSRFRVHPPVEQGEGAAA